MNRLPARVCQIDQADGVTLVEVETAGTRCTALLVGQAELQAGQALTLAFKEVEVSLARLRDGEISIRNILPCTIRTVEYGELLARVWLEFAGYPLSAVITRGSAERLGLTAGDQIEALIKANEMTLLAETYA